MKATETNKKVFWKNYVKAVVAIAAAIVITGIFLSGCGNTLTEEGLPSAIGNSSEAEGEELLNSYSSAISKAEYYYKMLSLSKASTIEDLMYIDGYTRDIAEFAVNSINADWRENALRKAKRYKEAYYMTDKEIFSRLTDPDRDNFTMDEADYALINLG